MVDAYTTRGGLIKPESGQSLNTWGTKLNNNAFDLIDKGLFGFETITVTTDFSLTRANGDATSTQLNKGIRLGGTPVADFAVTVLSYENIILWRNNTGKNATVKVSAGTGVTLADGQMAFLGYNAALGDITNVTANVIAGALTVAGRISGVVAGTNGTDAVNKTQMEAAIAVLAGGSVTGLVLNSSSDPAAGYLVNKLDVIGSGLTAAWSTENAGTVNEKSLLTLTVTPPDEGQTALIAGVYAL